MSAGHLPPTPGGGSLGPAGQGEIDEEGPTRRGMLPTRLLIDLPNWIGDQAMALPAIARLESANRGGLTVLHCRPAVGRLLSDLFPGAVVETSPRRASPFRLAWRLWRGRGRFDLGVTFRHASRAKILLRLVARRAVGSAGDGAALLLDRALPVDRSRHQVFDADAILGELGLPGVDPTWMPVLPPHLEEEAHRALAAAGVGPGRVVGLVPGAAWGESKQWPASRLGQLAARLVDRGLRAVIVIGPGEERLGQAVADGAGLTLPVVGRDLDVAGLAALVARCAVVVGNDSGPTHLAAILGTPVAALFGPTDPRRTAPLGAGHAILARSLPCIPCFEPRCPLGHHACLAGLEVEEVERAVLDLDRLRGRGAAEGHHPAG